MPDERSQGAVKLYLFHRMAMSLKHDGLLVNAWGRRLSPQGAARIIAGLAQQAGLERRVTPHMIRHTVATLLLRCGVDIRVVQEVLGHASIATTQLYTYVSKEHLLSTLHARHPNKHLDIEMPLHAIEGQLPLPFD
jgi:integrase/recombinase XerC